MARRKAKEIKPTPTLATSPKSVDTSVISFNMWLKIEELTNQHGYMSGVNREDDRVKKTGEVYTPTLLVMEICSQLIKDTPEVFAPGKTVLDPACGDGQFLTVAKWIKVMHYGMTEEAALKDIYGVDIMADNVAVCKKRLGGGNILVGNTMEPCTRVDGQSEGDYQKMIKWFYDPSKEEPKRQTRKTKVKTKRTQSVKRRPILFRGSQYATKTEAMAKNNISYNALNKELAAAAA